MEKKTHEKNTLRGLDEEMSEGEGTTGACGGVRD